MSNKWSLLWLTTLLLPIYVIVTRYKAPEITQSNFLQGYDNTGDEVNTDLFYQNKGLVEYAADPQVINYNGTYYMYATNANKNYDCSYLQCWSSKNLTDWTNEGICYQPKVTESSWCIDGLWAPEVIERNGMFYMYYSGFKIHPENEYDPDYPIWWRGHQIGVATSYSPTGPFIDVPSPTSDPTEAPIQVIIPGDGVRCAVIDASPFIDDNGDAYLLVTKDQYHYENEPGQPYRSSVLIARLQDNMTSVVENGIEGKTWKELVKPDHKYENVSGSLSSWNEAPFMYKRNGLYYLLYSANFYKDREYCICVATSTSPVGPFVKYDKPLLSALDEWDYVSGTGHCSLFDSPDGNELFMAYHVHQDPSMAGDERKIYFDRVVFEGEKMVVRGPSISPQPLPSGTNGYGNIAKEAIITVNGNVVDRLNDDQYAIFEDNATGYEQSTGATDVVLKVTFETERSINAVMLYDSIKPNLAVNKINRLEINGLVVDDIEMKPEYHEDGRIPMSAIIYEFNEMKTKEITMYLRRDDGNRQIISLNEVVVMGKVNEK